MRVRFFCLAISTLVFFLPTAAVAQDYQHELERFEQLKPDDAQVKQIFSLFLSQVPYMLDESVDGEAMVRELAPQAFQMLRPDQRRFLSELAPPEQLERFGTMTRDERTQFVLDQARALAPSSKKEWLDRVEEMTR